MLSLLYFLFVAADVMTTYLCLGKPGLNEGNPINVALAGLIGWEAWLTLNALIRFACYAIVAKTPTSPKIKRVGIGGLTAFFGAVTASNLILLLTV
ncbi:MAG: hypothetical protein QXR81_08140 [Candidatus Nezhaarchaeales archaeon]